MKKSILGLLPLQGVLYMPATQGVALGYVQVALSGRTFSSGLIIDSIYEPCQSLYFKSGGYMGLWWQYGDLIIPPIYDNIEVVGELEDPLLFTLNGVPGYVRMEDGEFVAKSEVDAIEDEDERHDRMFDFVCEQIDY